MEIDFLDFKLYFYIIYKFWSQKNLYMKFTQSFDNNFIIISYTSLQMK